MTVFDVELSRCAPLACAVSFLVFVERHRWSVLDLTAAVQCFCGRWGLASDVVGRPDRSNDATGDEGRRAGMGMPAIRRWLS